MPKRGRALLWPSVLDSDPNKKDPRTTHQALPVGKGSLKFGANVSGLLCSEVIYDVCAASEQSFFTNVSLHCFV